MFRLVKRFSSTYTIPVGRYNFSNQNKNMQPIIINIIKPKRVEVVGDNMNVQKLTSTISNKKAYSPHKKNIYFDEFNEFDEFDSEYNFTEKELKQMLDFVV